MDVRCEKCGTQYVLEDHRVPAGGAPVRCTTCGHVFVVHRAAPAVQAGTPGPGGATFVPGTPGPGAATMVAGTPGPAGATFAGGATFVPSGTPGPGGATFVPPVSRANGAATAAARSPDPISDFEASFGVAPTDPEERERNAHLHVVDDGAVPDLHALRQGGRLKYLFVVIGLVFGTAAVVYLLDRPAFDRMLLGGPEVPPPAVAKLEQARAAARLDTLAGYQQAARTAAEAVKLAGEVPFAEAHARIAIAYVGWADLMNERARRHQATSDAIAVPLEPSDVKPTCCPSDPAARVGLDELCGPARKGGKPCTELEEAANQAAREARDEARSTAAAAREHKEKWESYAIRDRADARERLNQALASARRARQLDPESALATLALAAYERASGNLAGFDKLAKTLEGTDTPPPPELTLQRALAGDEAASVPLLEKSAGVDAADARVHWLLAQRYDKAGRDADATKSAEKALALSPEHEGARGLLRVLAMRARRANTEAPTAPVPAPPAAPVADTPAPVADTPAP